MPDTIVLERRPVDELVMRVRRPWRITSTQITSMQLQNVTFTINQANISFQQVANSVTVATGQRLMELRDEINDFRDELDPTPKSPRVIFSPEEFAHRRRLRKLQKLSRRVNR